MNIKLYKEDLPENLDFSSTVCCDAEFTGLIPPKDKLCLIQIASIDSKDVHIVQFVDRKKYISPNLSKLLTDPNIKKYFTTQEKTLR